MLLLLLVIYTVIAIAYNIAIAIIFLSLYRFILLLLLIDVFMCILCWSVVHSCWKLQEGSEIGVRQRKTFVRISHVLKRILVTWSVFNFELEYWLENTVLWDECNGLVFFVCVLSFDIILRIRQGHDQVFRPWTWVEINIFISR